MRTLRSPSVHHVGRDPDELYRLADTLALAEPAFRGRYRHPSLALFNAHLDAVADRVGVQEVWWQGEVSAIRGEGRSWVITCGSDELAARRVILALGNGGHPRWPAWARSVREEGGAVSHVFDLDYVPDTDLTGLDIAVIGAGISGFHVARACAHRGARQVIVTHMRPLHVAEFDVEPGWLGPRFLPAFHACSTSDARHAVLDGARREGTVPRRVLDLSAELGAITRWPVEIVGATGDGQGVVLVSREGPVRRVDRVILATGFRSRPEGARWWSSMAGANALPVSARGVPAPPPSLEWGRGLYVMGALAELAMGPAARNVWGARSAARRIVARA